MKKIVFKANGDTFTLRITTCNSATESFNVKTKAVETGIQVTFRCIKKLQQYSLSEGVYENPRPAEIKTKNESSEQ